MSSIGAPRKVSTVFLVHGTYARGAPWSRPGSPLTNAIAEAFPDTRIVPFDWSGDNSHAARVVAGGLLASGIRQVAEETPGARIAIIGHSHGGNIALYALRDRSVAAFVSDVIFLGTPFFRFVRLEVRSAVRFYTRIVGFLTFFVTMCVGVIGAFWYFPGLPDIPVHGRLAVPFYLFLGMVIVNLAAITLYLLARNLATLIGKRLGLAVLSFLLRRRAEVFRRLATPLLPVRGLVFRSSRDEAFLYLSTLALVTSSPLFVWSVIVACTRSIPLVAAFLLFVRWKGNDFVPETDAFVSAASLYIGAIGIACLYPTALLAILLVLTIPALTRGNPYAFGWAGFLGAALVDIRPTPVPAAASGIPVSLISTPGRRHRLKSLIHSSYYSDPFVLSEIVSFLRGSHVGKVIRADDTSPRLWRPMLRLIAVGAAVAVSGAAMLRYDYVEQQKVIWEDGERSVPDGASREIFRAERTALRLDPRKAYTLKFSFATMAREETCRLVGHYRSDGSKIDVLVHTVRLSEHSDSGEFNRMVSQWYERGGDRLVPPKEPAPASGETLENSIRWALIERSYERGFQRSAIDFSAEYPERKEVHFNRVLSGTEPGSLGGLVIRNNGMKNTINVDLVVSIICRNLAAG